MDTDVTDTPITTVETVITTNEEIPGETMGDVHVGEVVEAETLTEVSKEVNYNAHKFLSDTKINAKVLGSGNPNQTQRGVYKNTCNTLCYLS